MKQLQLQLISVTNNKYNNNNNNNLIYIIYITYITFNYFPKVVSILVTEILSSLVSQNSDIIKEISR